MSPLTKLPLELIVAFWGRCDVQDVLNLCLVSRDFKAIIAVNLCSIAPASARTTFGDDMALLLDPTVKGQHTLH